MLRLGRHDERRIDHALGRVLLAIRSLLADDTAEAQGTVARRFGSMFSSQPKQILNVPAAMRRSGLALHATSWN